MTVSLVTPDGRTLEQRPAQVAQFDASGRSRLRFPIRLPAERWTLMRGSLQSDDALPWDDARDELVEIPPRKNVAVIDAPAALPAAGRIVRLALDPSAGQLSSWPLKVSRDGAIAADTSAVVLISAQWPDAPTTARLRDFVSAGGTLIWFLRPGLEEAWKTLPDASKSPLLELLPAAPSADATVPPSSTVAVAAPQEPALEGLTDRRFELSRIVVRRFVPLLPPADDVVTVLTAAPANPGSGSRPRGLLYRRPVGRGSVFTWATVPDKQYNNLATHPVFLPMLVGIALGQGAAAGDAQNVELGEPISLGRGAYASVQRLELVNPRGEVIAVDGVNDSGSRRFTFSATDAPGLYTWRKPGETTPVGIGNVQLPAEEAQLVYKSADAVAAPGPRVMVARSVAELENRFTALSEPEPKWSLPIAIVLLLLCVEALMASTSKLWKPPSLRAFVPKVGEST